MHAEDEFSAGSYGSAKRDAVRVLQGTFPVRIVVEGDTPEEVEPLVKLIDRQVALGALGHLPVGGHKTRGAAGAMAAEAVDQRRREEGERLGGQPSGAHVAGRRRSATSSSALTHRGLGATKHGAINSTALTLGEAAKLAKAALGEHSSRGGAIRPSTSR